MCQRINVPPSPPATPQLPPTQWFLWRQVLRKVMEQWLFLFVASFAMFCSLGGLFLPYCVSSGAPTVRTRSPQSPFFCILSTPPPVVLIHMFSLFCCIMLQPLVHARRPNLVLA